MSNNDKEQEKIKENNTNDDILENSNKIPYFFIYKPLIKILNIILKN